MDGMTTQLREVLAVIEAVREDYEHPWPGEDIATTAHRLKILGKANALSADELLAECEKADRTIASLPADWLEDSSLETWFPLTAETLSTLRDECERLRRDRDDALQQGRCERCVECGGFVSEGRMNLSDEQLNEEICKWLGWKYDFENPGWRWQLGGNFASLPSHITGPEALGNMHAALKVAQNDRLDSDQWSELGSQLVMNHPTVTLLNKDGLDFWEVATLIADLTARDLAIALLKVVAPEAFR